MLCRSRLFLGTSSDPDCPASNPFYYVPEGGILISRSHLEIVNHTSLQVTGTYSPRSRTELKSWVSPIHCDQVGGMTVVVNEATAKDHFPLPFMDQMLERLAGNEYYCFQETVWMVEEEAYASREAWARSIGLSQVTHQELQTHHDHVYAHETYLQAHQTQLQLQSTLIQTQHQVHETRFQMQHTELAALRETDRRRQEQMVETLRVIRDMRREMSDMQAELLALREQRRTAGQSGPEARIPDHQEASGDADSHI
ncbi:hypothetical protein Tco_0025101 [Tanacetum coccineum]